MIEFDPQALASQFEQAGHNWADLNAAAEVLEDTAKTLLAEIALEYMPKVGAVSKAEMEAKASNRYQSHLSQATEARRLSNRARVSYDAMRVQIDLIRSKESTERALISVR